MIRQKDVAVTKLFPSGAWECSVMYTGRLHSSYLVRRTFYSMSKREAVREFVREVNQMRDDPPGR